MAFAISKAENFQVIGFNKDGTQHRLFSASSLRHLLIGWAKDITRHEKAGASNILPTFTKIVVWNIEEGFTDIELPYIQTI